MFSNCRVITGQGMERVTLVAVSGPALLVMVTVIVTGCPTVTVARSEAASIAMSACRWFRP